MVAGLGARPRTRAPKPEATASGPRMPRALTARC